MKVYMSGPIDNATEELLDLCKQWRIDTTIHLDKHDIETIDPCRGGISPKVGSGLESIPAPPAAIVARDRMDIRAADLVLVYWPQSTKKRGIGTLMEISLASMSGLPIILVDPGNQVSDHPWIKNACTWQFTSLADARENILTYWSGLK